MDSRTFFRAVIPGYALLIPLFFYLRYLTCFNDTKIIVALIAAGFPFGIFLEWITETILHLHIRGHPVIGPRIRVTRKILGLRIRPQRVLNPFLLRNIRGHYLRGFLNFVLNSHEKFESHKERHTFLASRTHSLDTSMLSIILGNISGIIILKIQKGISSGQILRQILEYSEGYKDLWWTIIISFVAIIIFYFFYKICRNDLIAYERMLISRYREDFRDAWFLRTRG